MKIAGFSGFIICHFSDFESYISGFLVFRSRCLFLGGFVLGSVVSGGSDGDESGEDDELQKVKKTFNNFNNLRQFDC